MKTTSFDRQRWALATVTSVALLGATASAWAESRPERALGDSLGASLQASVSASEAVGYGSEAVVIAAAAVVAVPVWMVGGTLEATGNALRESSEAVLNDVSQAPARPTATATQAPAVRPPLGKVPRPGVVAGQKAETKTPPVTLPDPRAALQARQP